MEVERGTIKDGREVIAANVAGRFLASIMWKTTATQKSCCEVRDGLRDVRIATTDERVTTIVLYKTRNNIPVAQRESLQRGSAVRGIVPHGLATVVDVKWFGTTTIEQAFGNADGQVGNTLLYRGDVESIGIDVASHLWRSTATGICSGTTPIS